MVTPQNIKEFQKMVLVNLEVKLQEIADRLRIAKEPVGFILHEHLSIRNEYRLDKFESTTTLRSQIGSELS